MARLMSVARIGDWFQTPDSKLPFEVVAVDSSSETVAIQHFDGAVEEIDFDNWLQMEMTPAAAPEDYSGALDMDRDDFMYEDTSFGETAYMGNPLDDLDRFDNGMSFFE